LGYIRRVKAIRCVLQRRGKKYNYYKDYINLLSCDIKESFNEFKFPITYLVDSDNSVKRTGGNVPFIRER
jgi:hypothetical protein